VLSVAFFVCAASDISGTAEQIWAKFTWETCLVPRSDEFECQGQGSKVKVTRDKIRAVHSHHPLATMEWNTLAANNVTQLQMGPFHHYQGDGDFGGLRGFYVW